MADPNTAAIFMAFQKYMDDEMDSKEEIRAAVRELEQKAREILAVMQGIHQPDGLKNVKDICNKARALFKDIQAGFAPLGSMAPVDQYYRFHDHWRFVIQRCTFLAALVVYLESEALVSREDCCEMLGVQVDREKGFHLDLDDFLMGLLHMASELSRLAVNAVTGGDYSRPKRIAKFMADLDAGFRLLNLKNDSLRKRFDGLKYDLQKVEGVVYDVEIRGLTSKPATPE